MYERELICLANSIKHGGRCIAGKATDQVGTQDWIRPVSARQGRGLERREYRYGRFGGEIRVGDIARVSLANPAPLPHQPENHLIDGNGRWERIGFVTWTMLLASEDQHAPSFWRDHGSSGGGCADRVPELVAVSMKSSLQLVLVPRLDLLAQVNCYAMNGRVVRARFEYAGSEYILKVTDPLVCDFINRLKPGVYPWQMALICVSVTEPLDGFVYRVVASIITPKRIERRV